MRHVSVHTHGHDAGIRRQSKGLWPLAVANAGDPGGSKERRELLLQPAEATNLGNFKLNVSGPADAIETHWSRVHLDVNEQPVDWK
ncbi:MAG: hypothetical protein HKN35_03535 [Woeseia sp.]|nr:hypothetical protein [Woeseia sp.]